MGLLVFVTLLQLTKPEPALDIDFTVEEPRQEQPIDLHLELRNNTTPGEWSRTEDYELAATLGPLTFACNNHFIVRNMDEAQVVASYTIEY
jgi:hypothetical protein